MKQPENRLSIIVDEKTHYVDLETDVDGGFMNVELGRGKSDKSALKAAARRLRKLANEAERMAENG